MSVAKDEIIAVLYQCIDELNEQLPPENRLPKSPQTSFFPESGGLDSLGFVNLIALVEEKCEDRFHVAIMLGESRDEAENRSFETVEQLAKVISRIIDEKGRG